MKGLALLVPPLVMLATAAAAVRPTASRGAPAVAPNAARDTVTRRYDVRLGWTGYTGLSHSADCDAKANLQGYDSLVGVLTGMEDPDEPDEDVVYTGTLKRRTRVDYCEAQGRRSDADDEQAWCIVSVTAAATMNVEITVYGEDGRGAWMKATPDTVPVDSLRAGGTCRPPLIASIRAEYPDGGTAGSPDGQPIAEPEPPLFFVRGIARLRVGKYPPTPDSPWGLQVVRPLP